MADMVIARFLTRTGKVAIEVKRFESRLGAVSYGYTGAYGAGSGTRLGELKQRVGMSLSARRGIREDVMLPEYASA